MVTDSDPDPEAVPASPLATTAAVAAAAAAAAAAADTSPSSATDMETVDMSCVHDALPWVRLPRPIIGGLVELLRRLVESHGCNERNSLLTDRTFLVKAPRIMQARALLSGRTVVAAEDLRVLEYLTTYRVPPHVHQEVATIIDGVVAELE